jgi:hypothetical protein
MDETKAIDEVLLRDINRECMAVVRQPAATWTTARRRQSMKPAAEPVVNTRSQRPMILNITKPKATTNSALIPPDSIPKEVTVNFKGYLVSPPRWAIGPSWSPQATSANNIGCTVGGNFNVPSRYSPGARL